MNKMFLTALAAATLATTAYAQDGDAAAGEKVFNRCKACHQIVAPDGTEIVKGGQVGPNLYGIIGHQAGAVEGFKGYGDDLVKAGEQGLVWDEESFKAYVPDPKGFLAEYLGDSGARAKMAAQRLKEDDLNNVYAYLVSVAPPAEEGAATN